MLKQRVITAAILLLIFLSVLFMSSSVIWTLLVMVMVMQGASEWTRLAQFSGRMANLFWWATLAVLGAIVLLDAGHAPARYVVLHLVVYATSVALWLAIVPFWMGMRWQVRKPWAMALTGWAVLVPTGLAMMDLRDYSPWLLLGIMALVWIADSAAYFAGRRFGKRKLAPNISPGKTWEGVGGAMLAVTVYALVVMVVLTKMGLLDLKSMPFLVPNLLLAAWCWVALSILGDLFESAVKRQAGVKDSGALLPGHGGLLDRIDALTSTLPLAALALMMQRLA